MLNCFLFQCAEEIKASNVEKVKGLNNLTNGNYAAGLCELLAVLYSLRRPTAFIFQQVRMDTFCSLP